MNYLPPRVEVVWIDWPWLAHNLQLRSAQASLQSLRSLTFQGNPFDYPPFGDEGPLNLSFPALTTLSLDVYDETTKLITEHWHLPNLSTLSLHSRWNDNWMPLIRKCRHSIRRLDIGPLRDFKGKGSMGLPFNMPLLSSLAFEVNKETILFWIKFIRSTSLQDVSIYNINFIEDFSSNPERIKDAVQEVIAVYPSIKNVYLYERGRALSPQTRYGLSQQDISFLENEGVIIDIREDTRTRVMNGIMEAFTPGKPDLEILLTQHRDLRQRSPSFSCFYVPGPPETINLKATCSVGKYCATGERTADRHSAEESAAMRVIEMIREDIY